VTYSVVPTKATGDLLASSDWNTYVRDNFADHEARISANTYSGCLLTRTTNQSIPDASTTAITWTAETTDQGGWFTPSSSTITVPSGALPSGYTTIVLSIGVIAPWAGNAVGARSVAVYKNGATAGGSSIGAPDAFDMSMVFTIPDIEVVPGDTIVINVAQTSGGALNLLGSSLPMRCSVRRVGYF
jgi:hypothetical protein